LTLSILPLLLLFSLFHRLIGCSETRTVCVRSVLNRIVRELEFSSNHVLRKAVRLRTEITPTTYRFHFQQRVQLRRTPTTRHCPLHAAAAAIDRYLQSARSTAISEPAAAGLLLWTHAGTDRRTDTVPLCDPAPRTMRAVPIMGALNMSPLSGGR